MFHKSKKKVNYNWKLLYFKIIHNINNNFLLKNHSVVNIKLKNIHNII